MHDVIIDMLSCISLNRPQTNASKAPELTLTNTYNLNPTVKQ